MIACTDTDSIFTRSPRRLMRGGFAANRFPSLPNNARRRARAAALRRPFSTGALRTACDVALHRDRDWGRIESPPLAGAGIDRRRAAEGTIAGQIHDEARRLRTEPVVVDGLERQSIAPTRDLFARDCDIERKKTAVAGQLQEQDSNERLLERDGLGPFASRKSISTGWRASAWVDANSYAPKRSFQRPRGHDSKRYRERRRSISRC
jgi:hypothetical protein